MLDYSSMIEGSKAYLLMQNDMQHQKLSHAYMFFNNDKNYLLAFAENLVSMLLNQNNPELTERNKLRIAKRVHPDVLFFGETSVIDAATAADIVEKSQVAPFESSLKVFVLCGAETMNETSQNKILKTIEDPPSNTYFLFLCSNKTLVLPTILSRVKQIELDDPTTNEIEQMLISTGIKKEDAEVYAGCSGLNASFAEKLASDNNFLTFFGKVMDAFLMINGSRDVIKFSSYFAGKTIDRAEFVHIYLMICHDLIMVMLENNHLVIFQNELNKLKLIAASLNIGAVSTLASACEAANKSLHFNVGSVSVVDGLLFKIAEVKVKCKRS